MTANRRVTGHFWIFVVFLVRWISVSRDKFPIPVTQVYGMTSTRPTRTHAQYRLRNHYVVYMIYTECSPRSQGPTTYVIEASCRSDLSTWLDLSVRAGVVWPSNEINSFNTPVLWVTMALRNYSEALILVSLLNGKSSSWVCFQYTEGSWPLVRIELTHKFNYIWGVCELGRILCKADHSL